MLYLRYLTSGESHGRALVGILERIPSGLPLAPADIDRDLKRRQSGYGRGGRMKIEADRAEIISGVRWGKTIGSPITILIENKDYRNWLEAMSPFAHAEGSISAVTKPRPGHADLAGAIKYDLHDVRNILERSSARETAMRVALGAIAKKFLLEFGITIGSYVIQIGKIKARGTRFKAQDPEELLSLFEKAETSYVRCPDKEASKKMMKLIDSASEKGNSLGGIFEVFAINAPIGLGSHVQWDRRIDGRLAQALMAIPAIKGVEIGLGFEMARHFGSEVMDEIFYSPPPSPSPLEGEGWVGGPGFYRKTNFAGGIEGGMTNGMPIILRVAMKPIPTQKRPLQSVDIISKERVKAAYERSDICAVPAAGVIGEAMTALVIADAFLEKFSGDSIRETKRNYDSYIEYIKKF